MEPEEYSQNAASSFDVGATVNDAEAFATRSSYERCGPGLPPATSTWRRCDAWASTGPASAIRDAEITAAFARLSRRK